MAAAPYAEVLLPLPVAGPFTYAVPEALREQVAPGMRVIVPFGDKHRYVGLVRRPARRPPEDITPKALEQILDPSPLVTETHFRFWEWMADYYLCSAGEVMNAALPAALKPAHRLTYRLRPGFTDLAGLDRKERDLLFRIEAAPGITVDELEKHFSKRLLARLLPALLQKGAIIEEGRLDDPYRPRTEKYVRLNPALTKKELDALPERLKRAPKQWEIFVTLQGGRPPGEAAPAIPKRQLLQQHPSPAALKGLLDKGIAVEEERPLSRLERGSAHAVELQTLTPAQQTTLEEIRAAFKEKNTVLLHGITSSGKTEIYFHLIREMLKQEKQVLYLLPEIAITGQMIERLKKAFGALAGIYHSRYSDRERAETWKNLAGHDEAPPLQIVLGVRSAVFLPFRRLGLIIVDEEHETSYKQDATAPRYHARDAAVVLGHLTGAKVLLGSATPALESYFNARTGKYGLAELHERYGNILPPEIRVVDMKKSYKQRRVRGHLSVPLYEAVRQALNEEEQVILFQNRRGFSPYVQCADCGWIPYCKHCDVSLTYHQARRSLVCHYCGYTETVPSRCPQCGSTHIRTRGFGTEKIEEEVRLLFPDARPARLDLDTAGTKKDYLRIIRDFEEGRTNIFIGTQMITKGLDFGHVRVVGILNADNMLHFPDFRAWERSYQLMAQVSGRAGRRDRQGLVIIQTYDPAHPVIRDVIRHDYFHMYREQLKERKLFRYPPFYRLIRIILKHRKQETVDEAAATLAGQLRKSFGNNVLGPEYAFIPRLRNRYIKQILLKLERNADKSRAKEILTAFEEHLRNTPRYKGIAFINDVDPV